MNNFLVIFFLFVFVNIGLTQHCPFDNKGLVVVKVDDEGCVTQNEYQVVLTYVNYEGLIINQILSKNPEQSDVKKYRDSNYDPTVLHFDFAVDHFIGVVPMDKIEGAFISFVDFDGNAMNENFYLTNEKVFDLHEEFGSKWTQFTEDFSPEPWGEFNHVTEIKVCNIE